VSYKPTSLSCRPQEDVSAAILALLVFFLDACERGQLTRPVRPTRCHFYPSSLPLPVRECLHVV